MITSSTEESRRNSLSSTSTSSTLNPLHDECYKNTKYAESSFSRMEKYFLDHLLTDIILKAGERKIQAHKLVLCAASDYFSAMFMNNLRESTQEEIEIQGVDGDILWDLVHYCYTGNIDLREETVESTLSTASLLQLQEVTKTCCNFLKKQLHPSNCIGIFLFADREGCLELKEAAHNYTADHFMEVIRNNEFISLPEVEIFRLLSSDDLNVPNEEEIFKALMMWLENNIDSDKNVAKLLSLVRLPLLEPSFIVDHVETKPVFYNDAACQALIMEAMKYHLLPERRPILQNCRTDPRKSTVGTLYMIGGVYAAKGITTLEEYNYRSNKWSVTTTMNGRRLQYGIADINNKIYVVGGRDGLKTLNSFDCLDLKTKTWSSLPPMSTHRHGLGVAVLEGPLYAVGGHDGWSYLNTVERWDPDLRQWSYVSPMQAPRSTAGIAVLNKRLYVVGGRDGSSCLKTMEYYDPHTNKWTMCSPMSKRRGCVGVGVLNGYLYVVGGHDAPACNPTASRFDCVERYDPKTDSWTVITNMSVGRDSVGIGILGDKLFAIGGYDGQNYSTLVEVYNPTTNEWKQLCPLSAGRAGSCILTIKNTKKEANNVSDSDTSVLSE